MPAAEACVSPYSLRPVRIRHRAEGEAHPAPHTQQSQLWRVNLRTQGAARSAAVTGKCPRRHVGTQGSPPQRLATSLTLSNNPGFRNLSGHRN